MHGEACDGMQKRSEFFVMRGSKQPRSGVYTEVHEHRRTAQLTKQNGELTSFYSHSLFDFLI